MKEVKYYCDYCKEEQVFEVNCYHLVIRKNKNWEPTSEMARLEKDIFVCDKCYNKIYAKLGEVLLSVQNGKNSQ